MADHWLTRTEVARQLEIHTGTLERWARAGIGPRVQKLGPRLVRYAQADVDDWLACADDYEQSEQQCPPAPETPHTSFAHVVIPIPDRRKRG